MSTRFDSGGFYNTQNEGGPFGNVEWDSEGNRFSSRLTDTQQGQYDRQSEIFTEGSQGGTITERGLTNFAMGTGSRDFRNNYNDAQRMGFDRRALDQATGNTAVNARQMAQMSQGTRQRGVGEYYRGAATFDGAQDYGALQQSQLGLMRQQAAPQEERASNALAQKMFGMGQIGTEGGARQMESFGQGLANADTQRQLSSMDFARQSQAMDRQTGMSMMNMGNQSQAAGFNMLGTQQQTQMGNYSRSMNFNQNEINRGQQRMQASQGMFQFGQGIRGTNEARMGAAQAGQMGFSADLRDTSALLNSIRNGAGYQGGGNATASANPWATFAGGVASGAAEAYLPDLIDSWAGGSDAPAIRGGTGTAPSSGGSNARPENESWTPNPDAGTGTPPGSGGGGQKQQGYQQQNMRAPSSGPGSRDYQGAMPIADRSNNRFSGGSMDGGADLQAGWASGGGQRNDGFMTQNMRG